MTTPLTARRVARNVPIWNILVHETDIGSMTNLPMERAWCLTARYCGNTLNYRASSREAVMLALRCAVDAIDAQVQQDMDDYVEDEDGEIARMRHEENLAEAYSMRADMQEPCW